MKLQQVLRPLALLAAVTLLFSACKKDNPVHEHDNEEISTLTLTFTPQEGLDAPTKTLVFTSTDNANKELNLRQGSYKLAITAKDFDGHDITEEFVEHADEHQFFFVGPTKEQVAYAYSDANVGIEGIWNNLQVSNGIPVQVILMHGLNKQNVSAADWNNPDYFRIGGGTRDISISFNLIITD